MSSSTGVKFEGVYPPTITCFNSDGTFASDKQRNVIRLWLDNGVDGLWVLGSYGSFALLTHDERKQVAEFFLKEVNGQVPIIMQIGCPSTKETIELAKHAEHAGAQAVAATLPYYFSGIAYRPEDIVGHFSKLVESVNVPVFLYNNPKTTYFNVIPALLKQLADVGVKGLKDSSADYAQMADYIITVKPSHPDFVFFSGTAALLLPTLMLGGQGAVVGTGNAFPELVSDVYRKFVGGDYSGASEKHNLVMKVRNLQAADGFRPSSCYAMLRMRGYDPGTVRAPWREMPDEVASKVQSSLKELGVLTISKDR